MEGIWRRVYFALTEPAVEQTFVAFHALHIYRSIEQRILPMSLVMFEYYSRKTVSHHSFAEMFGLPTNLTKKRCQLLESIKLNSYL